MKLKTLNYRIKQSSLKMTVVLLSFVFFLACNKKDTNFNSANDGIKNSSSVESAKVLEAKATLKAFMAENPMLGVRLENHGAKRGTNDIPWNADMSHYEALLEQAIDPDDYECESTELRDYNIKSVADWDTDDRNLFNAWNGLIFDYAYVYQNDNTNGTPTFGVDGEYTQVNNKTFKSLQGFWDISTNIYLTSVHGDFYSDEDKLTEILELYRTFGFINPATTDDEIEDIVDALITTFGSDRFWNYEHHYLSFNAFAARADGFFGTPKKIVMGDGIQDAYDALGYGDVATQGILAHEYGHHIQFANDVYFGPNAEDTRRTELMADAFAAYYLTHKRGATMNWKRVQKFLSVFYNIGDCGFSKPSHHGTPNQRMKAAKLGYDVASDTKQKGKIMSSADFIELFDEELDDIIASDK
jgi:hypothetical protein